MKKNECAYCKFFTDQNSPYAGDGWCRRNPPVIVNAFVDDHSDAPTAVHLATYFPGVASSDWCGEFVRVEP